MSTSTISLQPHPFPNYTQLRSFLPQGLWHTLRALSVVSALAMAYLLWTQPTIGLPVFWGLAVPILPLVFFIAPGVWRNICPLAASNQLPRLAGISRAATNKTLSEGLAFPIGMVAFFVLVTGRKFIFNTSGEATALLIGGAMLAALVGGLLFKGKSGWCSSVCPLLPVQRLYGQTPFVKVANTHCQPCLGCAKNCYDFNPGTAYLADQYDAKRGYRSFRRFFAGVFPGFVLAFYLVPSPPLVTPVDMLLQMSLYMAISLALFQVLDMLMQSMVNVAPLVFASAAINIYYWFSAPTVANTLTGFGVPVHEAVPWAIRGVVLAGSLLWLWRSTVSERMYLAYLERQARNGLQKLTPIMLESLKEFAALLYPERKKLLAPAGMPPAVAKDLVEEKLALVRNMAAQKSAKAELCIQPDGQSTPLRQGQSLLDAIEACDAHIEAGCRMGVCGADPIAVTSGMEHLSPIGDDERATLNRLGCADNTRMACSARMRGVGEVVVELKPHAAGQARPSATPAEKTPSGDPAIRSVVVIGNGIAGITAAEHARRLHPGCEIHVVSRENHALYNRMGIARLINGRSGMNGLHLLPDSWYQEKQITSWLNTHVLDIDMAKRQVRLATNEHIAFDRLILANGSSAWVPPIEGFGAPGSFVLREADEAMGLRDYIQRHGCRTAVVAGAGLLGLEAAQALQKLGLKVAVLSNTPYILDRQLDSRSSHLLQRYLESKEIEILTSAEAATLGSDASGRVRSVVLKDGGELPADIFLACTGVKPNIDLAKSCGIATGRGILVDDRMQTNLPGVYAAGDVAEHDGIGHGLWPVAVEQGEVAAINALGGQREYAGYVPSTMLKVTGIDLLSAGSISARGEGEREIVDEQPEVFKYRKLVIASGRLVGAILIGYPDQADLIAGLVKKRVDLSPMLAALRQGNWEVLEQQELSAAA
jgi:nitrite reductase (NADH) large subunit